MAETPDFDKLIEKLTSGELSAAERSSLNAMLEEPGLADALRLRIDEDLASGRYVPEEHHAMLEVMMARIMAGVSSKIAAPAIPVHSREERDRRAYFLRRFRWAAAAILIGLAVLTGVILSHKKSTETASVYKNDIAPGKPGAKLKLSGGRVIELDSMKDGLIASEGGYQIYKQKGEIIYKGAATGSAEIIYNELISDKKQMSSATLPDGSIAWVNASSSVRYPVQFTGNERKVTMTGEAIFRVTHNEKQPFRVYAGEQMFEDVGTEFNVNAYPDEPMIRTTVLEGSVKTGTTLIGPGQQASVGKNGPVQLITADTEQVFAWRDQQFNFSGSSIEQIMAQAARWYGVEVVYEGQLNQQFTIGFSRDKTIVEFLQALERAGHVHFEVEGKRVTVKP